MDPEIIIVSGLPSLRHLADDADAGEGGIEVVTDNLRTADTDNPRGYYEFEQVKKIKEDASWLPETRGKAFKMVSQLLFDLPPTRRIASSSCSETSTRCSSRRRRCSSGSNRPAAPRDAVKRAFVRHLEKLHSWLVQQENITILRLSYNDLVARPAEMAGP